MTRVLCGTMFDPANTAPGTHSGRACMVDENGRTFGPTWDDADDLHNFVVWFREAFAMEPNEMNTEEGLDEAVELWTRDTGRKRLHG